IENDQALKELKDVADYYLINNRDIENSCDDSVGMMIGERWQLVRRARGYVPLPVKSADPIKQAFCCGGDLKSTFALASDRQVFLSQPWGDLDNYLNYLEYRQAAAKMMNQLRISPEIIVHDLHPEYRTTKYAKELSKEWSVPVIAVQHHHAHMASCMADNGLKGQVMAVICDGTGYGSDGAIWGFEFLTGDYRDFFRIGHLAYIPLLGGEASIIKTSRTAFSFVVSTLGEEGSNKIKRLLPELSDREREIMKIQLEKKINSPLSSSCGRLFDAAAALLGICTENEYEGQGPMELESVAAKSCNLKKSYSLGLKINSDGTFELDSTSLWKEMLADLLDFQPIPDMAYAFHFAVAKAIRDGVVYMADQTGLNRVVFSGGVFQNKLLASITEKLIIQEKVEVYTHRQVPPNDGGLSLGQAFIGNEVVVECA
ncbi:MAG: carbamoyltransferase HypF, partial [Peptococcaceae bacterium]|nr:carbamoyltransferase HypF [Peptococcaceae bacterium]